MTNPTPIRDEAQRQAVILLFSAAGAVVTILIVYHFSNPDALKTLKMSALLRVKRFAQKQVDRWQELADKTATLYNREKP
jgi:hypothetical protein